MMNTTWMPQWEHQSLFTWDFNFQKWKVENEVIMRMMGTCFYLFIFSRRNHAVFKEELQCMSGWILFTLENVVSLWEENLKYMSKSLLKWFKVYAETNGLTDFLPFFFLFSWCHGTLQHLNFLKVLFSLLRFIFICYILCYKWSLYFSFQIIGRFIL